MCTGLFLLLTAIALPPKPDHYVTDHAGLLKNASALDEKLANFERQTSDQILVYVDQHIPPNETIEEIGADAIAQWGVGQKGKDNGAILFVFVADRKMRIEVGYGLEGSLTDAKAKWITSTIIKPEFQRGDFNAGINKGVDAMLATARGESYSGTGKIVAELRHRLRWSLLRDISIVLLPVLLIIFVVMNLRNVIRRGIRWDWTSSSFDSDSSSSWDSSSSSSSDSSSSSSSSFEGGGGSGGGGGASDSW